jgi:hypothetical protein
MTKENGSAPNVDVTILLTSKGVAIAGLLSYQIKSDAPRLLPITQTRLTKKSVMGSL